MRSTSAVIASSFRASTPKGWAAPPSARICSTKGASFSPFRRATQAMKPSRAKRRAMALPSASPAPMTSAALFSMVSLP
jgi:hypothetical protein